MSTAKAEITEYPKVSGQSVDVVEGSPLALIGVFVEIVRARFRGRNVGLPWLWKNDPTPEEWEENTPEKPHLIYIESQFQDNNESRNYRPAIFVGKGDTRPSKIILGHRAGIHRPTRLEGFFCLASVPINIACISHEQGESAVIADLTWMHLLACQNYYRPEFGIHEVTPPVLGTTQVYRRHDGDSDTWNTPITLEAQIEFRWITEPVAPRLQEVRMILQDAGSDDPQAGAITIATHNRFR